MSAASLALTASGQVKARPGALVAVIITGGADAASVTVYDNTVTSGTILAVVKAAINTTVTFCPAVPIVASKGLYATITGTTPNVTVVFA